jgi:hypothetical protein
MQTIGRIVRVQAQREPLKIGKIEDGNDYRTYRTEPIITVARLKLTPDGAVGITESGDTMIDAHNVKHPQTRNTGKNFISFGFTHHYVMMRDRFGDHVQDGVAGENLIIEAEDKTGVFVPPARIGIQIASTGETLILDGVIVAPPCLPFTYFCAQSRIGGKDAKEALQFLDHGTRGYYARVPDGFEGEVRAGDVVVSVE